MHSLNHPRRLPFSLHLSLSFSLRRPSSELKLVSASASRAETARPDSPVNSLERLISSRWRNWRSAFRCTRIRTAAAFCNPFSFSVPRFFSFFSSNSQQRWGATRRGIGRSEGSRHDEKFCLKSSGSSIDKNCACEKNYFWKLMIEINFCIVKHYKGLISILFFESRVLLWSCLKSIYVISCCFEKWWFRFDILSIYFWACPVCKQKIDRNCRNYRFEIRHVIIWHTFSWTNWY